MIEPTCNGSSQGPSRSLTWHDLADRVLDGSPLATEEGLAILRSPDEELLDLLSAAFRVRRRYFGRTVHLCFLMNAKSGLCPEDCRYCSQSRVSTAHVPKYNLVSRQQLLDGARAAYQQKAKTYCIVISSRGPSKREMEAVTTVVPEIKQRYALKICACLGLLTPNQARQLKDCGVDRVNHNVNTSPQFYERICSTHTYQNRIDTLRAARDVGLEICCGGIVGLGEQQIDVVRMAFEVRELAVDAIPVNFLQPIDGTPLAGADNLNPRYCLKVLALFRLANPARDIRIAGGRELHLGSLQPLGLYAANSIFVGDYLTTKGQLPEADYQMIEQMGFVVTRGEQSATEPVCRA